MGDATELIGVKDANVTWRPTSSGGRRFNVRKK